MFCLVVKLSDANGGELLVNVAILPLPHDVGLNLVHSPYLQHGQTRVRRHVRKDCSVEHVAEWLFAGYTDSSQHAQQPRCWSFFVGATHVRVVFCICVQRMCCGSGTACSFDGSIAMFLSASGCFETMMYLQRILCYGFVLGEFFFLTRSAFDFVWCRCGGSGRRRGRGASRERGGR